MKLHWVFRHSAWLVCGMFLTTCTPPTDAPTTGNISGTILDASSAQPISSATITTDPITSSKTTDSEGAYTIEGVEPGTFTVQASKTDYQTNTTIVNVVVGETASADIQLTPQGPDLTVSTTLLNLGTSSTNLTFSITNTGVGTLTWNIISNANWVTVNPASGSTETETDVVTVTVNRTGMSYGNHYETITVASNTNSKTIDILMTIQNPNQPQLSVSPITLDFGASETQMSFYITNSGTGMLTWNITDDKAWISVDPQSGTTETEPDEIVITLDRLGHSPGTYTGTITVSSDGGNENITVTMTVSDEPTLSIIPTSLDFGSSETMLSFDVANAGSGDLTWSVTDNQEWITTSPISGTNYSSVNVSVSRDGLSTGDYSGTVTVSSNGGTDDVSVLMNVPADEPPSEVVLLSPSAITENSMTLNWSRNFDSDFAAYKVYRDLGPAVSQSSEIVATITSSGENYYTDTGLQAATTYYYRVYVMDMESQHTASNVVSASTLAQLGNWSVNATLGTTLLAVDALNESFAVAVGSGGVIYFYDGNNWTEEISPTTSTIKDVKIISQNDIWAVGADIYHYDGITWSVAYEAADCFSVDALSANDIYVGSAGLIYHYDGDVWTTIAVGSWIMDIQMDSENEGWALGSGGKIFYYNGFGWSEQYDGGEVKGSARSFHVITSSDIWVGVISNYLNYYTYAFLYRFTDTTWSISLDEDTNENYIGDIWAFSSSSVWFVGGNKRPAFRYIYYWNGADLVEIMYLRGSALNSIHMFSETDGWAVGENGVILRYH